jgi:hypothetical protein
VTPVRRRRAVSHGLSAVFHAALLIAIGQPEPPARAQPAAGGSGTIEIFTVPPPDGPPGLNPLDGMIAPPAWTGTPDDHLAVGGFTFDVPKIAERAALLFPFLSPGLALERFALAPPQDAAARLVNPLSVAEPADPHVRRKPALRLSGRALQQLLDESWSRRDRWRVFGEIERLAAAYDADVGQLPELFQAYVQQNGLQPYFDPDIRDPRLWTQLGLMAEHVDFVGFISRFAFEHRSSKAATELLFLLDKLAQGSRDVLLTLIDTDPAEALRATRALDADAYQLVVQIRRYYDAQLARLKLTSVDAIRTYYDRVRLGILNGILATTPDGYRAGDARYLIGAIHWRRRNPDRALDTWRSIAIEPTDAYAAEYSQILSAVRRAPLNELSVADRRTIDAALDNEHARWLMFSWTRLRQFGYRFDTF